ncbi:CheA signal transduction histidine kinase [[Leptolyngbya] sp. PCC 7376]|uniref:hybrid sensor histidine kinase/response regulator n=1 Tax=[Leptolyngbya] sp. PCC 7376 TaxID=111781 RepID=UPI00029EC99A|nr:response regulator [[Leptolyngbya] sp. PCC 7376]AFY37108.1 CheA signal transduction histidine kinase [[Leptolyngbya] sp. PCC 7376]
MLDAASLKAIALETRHCFLLEDAPDFINLFNDSAAQLREELQQPTGADTSALYKNLVRAAHSIKGGAGLAELSLLNRLAHKMEDLLELMAEGRIQDQFTGIELVSLAMEEVQSCIDLASTDDNNPGESAGAPELIQALAEFLETADAKTQPSSESANNSATPSKFVATALSVDLEACVKRMADSLETDATPHRLSSHFQTLTEECQLLGEALSLPWLQNIAVMINQVQQHPAVPLKKLAELAIAEIRNLSNSYLKNPDHTDPSPDFQDFVRQYQTAKAPAPQPIAQQPEPSTLTPVAATATATQIPAKVSAKTTFSPQKTSTVQVRMPIDQLNRMGNAVGELFIGYEQLSRHHQQLQQASRNLKQRTLQLNPIHDEVTTLYDKLASATPGETLTPNNAVSRGNANEFDSLHFDQYTQAHSNLQQFQELMVQVQEIREDIELIRWEFQNSLDSMRQQLEYLNQDLTQSRLIPFGKLARRFISSLETLSKRYPQSAQLQIIGEQVLIDQAILEQLRTPLTHLIRNAFDHGIEAAVQRRQVGKPDVGTITVSAKLQGNMVEVEVSDDGKGIDIERVWQKALDLGLYTVEDRDHLSDGQILDLIFSPGFSTRQEVTDLSGRGMGLDIVRLELGQLSGTVLVNQQPQQGTKFVIRIPLSFNILPLLLCRCQQQIIALPSVNVQAIISLADKDSTQAPPEFLNWQGQNLKLHALDQLLPYTQSSIFLPSERRPQPVIGVVVRQDENSMAIAVDEIIGERELVLKALNQTVAYPSYVAGCTVLGSGEVVPVLVPDAFDELLEHQQTQPVAPAITETSAQRDLRQPSILVIDDSVAVRRTLDKMLTQCGYQVHQCRDGKEAWNFLNRSNQVFDLAICDLEMPGYDGFTLLQMVRGQQQWNDLPFVMLTSRDNDLHRQKAKKLGANNYFTKPFQPIQFLEAISAYVS